jgi:HSP20 family protein
MRIRTYSNRANEAAAFNNVMNRFFNTVAYDYSRSGGSAADGASGAANGTSNGHDTAQSAAQSTVRETMLPIDVWATPEAFQVNAYLPGVNPEEVEITFEGEELTIRGKLPSAPEGTEFIKAELYHGTFARRLSFNVPVDADHIEAHFENGLLTLNIPKAEAVKPKQIKIQTK